MRRAVARPVVVSGIDVCVGTLSTLNCLDVLSCSVDRSRLLHRVDARRQITRWAQDVLCANTADHWRTIGSEYATSIRSAFQGMSTCVGLRALATHIQDRPRLASGARYFPPHVSQRARRTGGHVVREKSRPRQAELAHLAKSMVSPQDLDHFTNVAFEELARMTGAGRDRPRVILRRASDTCSPTTRRPAHSVCPSPAVGQLARVLSGQSQFRIYEYSSRTPRIATRTRAGSASWTRRTAKNAFRRRTMSPHPRTCSPLPTQCVEASALRNSPRSWSAVD